MRRKSIGRYFLFILLLTVFVAFSASASSVGFDLDLDTLSPADVNRTNATFRANFSLMDSSLDSALIYWNYTDRNSGLTSVGPVNISYSADKVINETQMNLDPDSDYSIESFAAPIEWDNYSMVSNFLDLANLSSDSKAFISDHGVLSDLNSTSESFTALFGAEGTMRELMDNASSKEKIFSSTGNGEVSYRTDDVFLDPKSYNEYAGVETDQVINLTGVSEIKVNFSAVINNNNDANLGDDYVSLYLNDTEEKVWGDNTLSNLPVGIRTVDTSSVTGLRTLEFRAVRTGNGAGYETHDIEASLYDIFINSSGRMTTNIESINGGSVTLSSRTKPAICDLYSSESGCVSNSRHALGGQNIVISRSFNSTKNSLIESTSGFISLDLNSSSYISGIWRGNININSTGDQPLRLKSRAKFRPLDGEILLK